MITKKYTITTNKNINNITIAVLSDLHFYNNFNNKIINDIKNNLYLNKPNYICIPGDIIDNTDILNNNENKKLILNFFKDLGKIAPTYVSLGNHDYMDNNKKEVKSKFWKFEFIKLEKHNIHLLDNKTNINNQIRFIGFTLPYKYYYNQEQEESSAILIKEFQNNFKKIKNDKLNILLCHSPIRILEKNTITTLKELKNIDIVFSGHMHNGMIPKILDNIFPKNKGFIAPNKTLYPDNARGIKTIEINNKKITLLISGGITKIHNSAPKIFQLGNYLYQPQLEYITIKPFK